MTPVEATEIARSAVRAAARVALEHFCRDIVVREKVDRSPVTDADLAAEEAVLQILRARDPTASVLAEESGAAEGTAGRRWIVDPIDGTRGFARGGEYWGPMVALERDGQVVAGAMALPARGELFWATRGAGAFEGRLDQDGEKRLAVSALRSLEESTLSLGETTRLLRPPHGDAVRALIDRAASTRGFGDLAASTWVARGQAEVWLECGVAPWDLAVPSLLVEEAGGRFSTFSGGADVHEGTAVGTNGHLHVEVMAALSGARPG